MPDPSCNPYLALAVMLRAGLDGVERKLDPGPPINKNIYRMSHRERRHHRIDELPGNLTEALDEMEKDPLILDTLGEHCRAFIEAKRDGGSITSSTYRRGRWIVISASTDGHAAAHAGSALDTSPRRGHRRVIREGRAEGVGDGMARIWRASARHGFEAVDAVAPNQRGVWIFRQALAPPHPAAGRSRFRRGQLPVLRQAGRVGRLPRDASGPTCR
jgi:hypothetical protein